VRFEWDPGKAEENFRKHGVSFNEAKTAFPDSLAATFDDPDHSIAERRLLTVGYSSAGRLLVVSHTEFGAIIRIINARLATARERKRHET
jgi:hypothetical protein